jgi:hypothetical protein
MRQWARLPVQRAPGGSPWAGRARSAPHEAQTGDACQSSSACCKLSFIRRLFLVRHAKVSPPSAATITRKLTKGGRADAKRVAKALAARHFLPDVLIHSGAARAKENHSVPEPSTWAMLSRSRLLCQAIPRRSSPLGGW